jgi:AcrR family transcriptional regulator
MARKRKIDRDSILDAAERIVLKHGVQAVTLDLVAAESGVSKGGLTYTFASKEAMLTALLERDVARYRAQFGADKAMAGSKFPELYAFLEICRASKLSADKKIGPLLAAIVHAPDSLKSAQTHIQWMLSKLSPGSADGERARLVFFAVQGLMLLQAFGLLPMQAIKRRALIEEFMRFLPDPAR